MCAGRNYGRYPQLRVDSKCPLKNNNDNRIHMNDLKKPAIIKIETYKASLNALIHLFFASIDLAYKVYAVSRWLSTRIHWWVQRVSWRMEWPRTEQSSILNLFSGRSNRKLKRSPWKMSGLSNKNQQKYSKKIQNNTSSTPSSLSTILEDWPVCKQRKIRR